jgi:hypothetical protein
VRALILVIAAFALSACGLADSGPKQVTGYVINPVTAQPKPQAVQTEGRLGYGALKLGMSETEAIATGLAGTGKDFRDFPDGQCRINDHITVSTQGVERIVFPKEARTSAGISAGDTVAAVRAAYPNVVEDSRGLFAEIPGDGRLMFETGTTEVPRGPGEQVTAIKLLKRRLACTGGIL